MTTSEPRAGKVREKFHGIQSEGTNQWREVVAAHFSWKAKPRRSRTREAGLLADLCE